MFKYLLKLHGKMIDSQVKKIGKDLDIIFYEKNSLFLSSLKKLYIWYELTRVKSEKVDSLTNKNYRTC